jgi:hypothetical protein
MTGGDWPLEPRHRPELLVGILEPLGLFNIHISYIPSYVQYIHIYIVICSIYTYIYRHMFNIYIYIPSYVQYIHIYTVICSIYIYTVICSIYTYIYRHMFNIYIYHHIHRMFSTYSIIPAVKLTKSIN